MILSLCLSALFLLSAVACASKDGDAGFVPVEFAKRFEPDTRGYGQLLKRIEATKLDRRHTHQAIGPPHGKTHVPTDTTSSTNLHRHRGKPAYSMNQRFGHLHQFPPSQYPPDGYRSNGYGYGNGNIDRGYGNGYGNGRYGTGEYDSAYGNGSGGYDNGYGNGYGNGRYGTGGYDSAYGNGNGGYDNGYGNGNGRYDSVYGNGNGGYDSGYDNGAAEYDNGYSPPGYGPGGSYAGDDGSVGTDTGYGAGTMPGLDVTSASGSGMYAAGGAEGYSIDGVLGGYNGLLDRIESYRRIIVAGQISMQIAIQQIEQLAVQFQAAISQFQACTPCLASGSISSFGGVFSRLFSSFYSLVSSYQQVFPNNLTSMFGGAFSGLNTSLASFLGLCQSSGLAVNTFFPTSLATFFGRIGFGSVTGRLQQFGYTL